MILRRIDDFLFDRVFQPLVNRFPDAGPAGVARFFMAGDIAFTAITEALDRDGLMAVVIDQVVLALCYTTAGNTALKPGARNPQRIRPVCIFFRLICLSVAALEAGLLPFSLKLNHTCSAVGSLLFVAYLYADCCDKLPPKPRRKPVWSRVLARASA